MDAMDLYQGGGAITGVAWCPSRKSETGGCLPAQHPLRFSRSSGRARCGAGAGCSAIKCQSLGRQICGRELPGRQHDDPHQPWRAGVPHL